MWFSYLDNQIEWLMLEIKSLERCQIDQDKVMLSLPNKSVPRTTGYYCLNGKYAHTEVGPDRKRCQKRFIKKGRMDVQYLEEFEEEHFSSMKSSELTYRGTQELHDMVCF